MTLPIVYINSWPGAGKRKIAEALKHGLEERACVIHNHEQTDLAESILPRTSDDYQKMRRRLRAVLFRSLIHSKDTHDKIYIFTDFQSTNEPGPSIAKEYLHTAEKRDCTFIPIILHCDDDENARRMTHAKRKELVEKYGKEMLMDTVLLRHLKSKVDLYRFNLKEELILDVTGMPAKEIAVIIYRHISGVTRVRLE